ncbi:hypothetical protein GJ700_30660 [Duganella sp. FT92W]|uniref:Peptidase C14 caspase domain-containing protein n=1 Tax=Pseudoduganella rivuli TaxID=2666085 RepID=A0A7X2IUD2_9BURK|nr:caspase family protein [Pseudoduganella rivuli]MRV76084.1 hypothetical protein [Pseudoduganella rivuli]
MRSTFSKSRSARILGVALLLFSNLVSSSHASELWLATQTNNKVRLYNYSRALLIGQSKFGLGWNELTHVPADLKKIKDALTTQGFDEVAIAENLDGRDILPRIQEFVAKDTGHETRTIVYVTGHGWTDPNGVTYLVGSDAALPGPTSQPQFARMLSVTTLRDLHVISRALHTLLVLDSCYSGAILQTKSAASPTRLAVEQLKKPVYQILASGQKNQRVAGDGTFADMFVSGLSGAAAYDRASTFITFRQLANWLFFELPKRSNQVPVYADYPTPDGDMVFLTKTKSDEIVGASSIKETIIVPSREEAAQQTRISESGTFRAIYPKTQVYYYRKTSDDLRVVNAMNKLGVDYIARPPELPDSLVTNGLACGPTTPPNAIKALARALIRDGVPIARIAPYNNAQAKQGRIEVLSTANGIDPITRSFKQNLKPLSEIEIDSINSCRSLESKS